MSKNQLEKFKQALKRLMDSPEYMVNQAKENNNLKEEIIWRSEWGYPDFYYNEPLFSDVHYNELGHIIPKTRPYAKCRITWNYSNPEEETRIYKELQRAASYYTTNHSIDHDVTRNKVIFVLWVYTDTETAGNEISNFLYCVLNGVLKHKVKRNN